MENNHLSVLVALRTGNFSGVETYAEQVALAAAAAGNDVTLVVAGHDLAAAVSRRVGAGVRVIEAEPVPVAGWRSPSRRLPTVAMGDMRAVLGERLRRLGEWFDVAHLNHPGLASAARPFAARVVVRAWFYPHQPGPRVAETWHHSGGASPRSVALALKSLAHYWNDRHGYAASDCVVAPTALLAEQLRSKGIFATECPPPGRRPTVPAAGRPTDGIKRVTICCGDMSHPRKNVRAGIQAVGILGRQGTLVDLELIGGNTAGLQSDLRALPKSVQVITPGRLSREEVDERLGGADLLLVPSLYEEWGYVATEALLAGTPVVAFPVYPFVEMLKAPLGTCASDMTPHALALAMRQVLDAEAGRPAIATAADSLFGSEAIGARLSRIWTAARYGERVGVGGAAGAGL